MSDISSVLIEAFVKWPPCHTNVLDSAVLAFDQIDDTLCLTSAGGRCVYPIRFASVSASKSVGFLDVITGLTVVSFTSLVSNIFYEGDSKLLIPTMSVTWI